MGYFLNSNFVIYCNTGLCTTIVDNYIKEAPLAHPRLFGIIDTLASPHKLTDYKANALVPRALPQGQFAYVADFSRNAVVYTVNFFETLGYLPSDFLKPSDFYRIIYAEDQAKFLDVAYATLHFVQDVMAPNGNFLTSGWKAELRIVDAKGKVRQFIRQVSGLDHCKEAATFATLVHFIEVTELKSTTDFKYMIFGPDAARFNQWATQLPGWKPKPKFTPRELEIMSFLAASKTSEQIALLLHISEHTVRTHRANMLRRVNADGTIDLLRIAEREGLLVL